MLERIQGGGSGQRHGRKAGGPGLSHRTTAYAGQYGGRAAHLAAALVQAGHASCSREAFDRWLGDNGPAYVAYDKFSAAEGIQLLRACGAVPVWAHPYLFRGGMVATLLPQLVAAGLMGVEVYHPNHSPSEVRRLEDFCRQYDLIMTGGSDYHGPSGLDGLKKDRLQNQNKTGQKTSHAELNQLHIPLALLAPLQAAASRNGECYNPD
ncbi:MAG: hypothetical protein HC922_02860 [Leptolyngbyaceae cyanobacterium SM2_3_12]|nr:hypothetical protein [Leptolyngbyaceae cyanobacterium SM2_3_12]